MYKGILLDIDNTLYQYDPLHELASKGLFAYIEETFNKSEPEIKHAFDLAKQRVKQNTPETAASHNRLLYVQNLCEILGIHSLVHSLVLYKQYWDTFLEGLKLTEGAQQFFGRYGHLPICLVTDLTAHIQHRKIAKLELNRWADCMVTSEEAGCEKPHPFMFQLALNKLNLQASEVCMIGDSYKKDIQGAKRLGIDAFWLTDTAPTNTEVGVSVISDLGDIQW